YSHLREEILPGRLADAAVDVFPTEPKRQGDPFESELRDLPNVILTPHVGGSTEEAQADIGKFVSAKLRDYLKLGTTNLSVNVPALVLEPPRAGDLRIAHLHQNVPGVLAGINQVLSGAGANIESQVLGTVGNLGYSVTDVSSGVPAEVVDHLERIDGTIRV